MTQAAAPCTYSINPASQSVAVAGGTGSTAVTAPTGCAWTGVSNDTSWLTVTSGASGSGGGSVAFSATANANPTQRSGTLTIGGQTFTVTQAGAACTYSINPTSQSVAVAGGTGSTTVTTPTGCAWTGVSNSTSWLTVTSGASGNGTGTVAFSAAANPNANRAQRHAHDRRADVLGDAGGGAVHVFDQPGEPVGGSRRRHGVDSGDGTDRLCVDGREQQHVVADGDERCEREWWRDGRLQRRGQSQWHPAQRLAHDRRADSERDAGRGAVHVRDQSDEPGCRCEPGAVGRRA